MIFRTVLFATALAVSCSRVALAGDIALTTLEWPPYSGADLSDGGLSVKAAKAAADANGDTITWTVLPWQRAVQSGLEEDGFLGYFPEYYSEGLTGTCAFSDSLGDSPLGFVERSDDPLEWTTLEDLAAYSIGTVQGYVNTEAFDAMAAEGKLTIEAVADDVTNLRKVAAGRIKAAVIDRNVMEYLIENDASLTDEAGTLRFNDHLLENKTLHVCFRQSPEGLAALERFNGGLAKVGAAK
ncbi:MAG: transporter substrate-binding domain-containing protein [Rhodospirillum sp.]|nr:transporter substrate-binding domain-containing protein [Rhodospirillum sp.]MCF8490142.1 transporter substrate-binding domain-containing protein [Rhodospirillum sp.]MCF8502215.1 transporter substrate-binding domain-containing protein [Rhodospirillum sp.]